jgi:predicted enzyme related to lactoylglutathione lyase
MTLRITTLGIDATDPTRLARFWSVALGWTTQPQGTSSVTLVPTDSTPFGIEFRARPLDAKREKNRLHFDVTTSSLPDQQATVQQLLDIGATHADVGQTEADPHVVLADPEGNEFCVIEPGNQFLAGCGRLGSITCDGSRAVGVFWSTVLGWPLVWDQDEETAIKANAATGPFITWGPPVKPKVMINRFHLDLAMDDGADPEATVAWLIALGATRADDVVAADAHICLRDPDENEFWLRIPDR